MLDDVLVYKPLMGCLHHVVSPGLRELMVVSVINCDVEGFSSLGRTNNTRDVSLSVQFSHIAAV